MWAWPCIVPMMSEYRFMTCPPVAISATMTIKATRTRIKAYSTNPWPDWRTLILFNCAGTKDPRPWCGR